MPPRWSLDGSTRAFPGEESSCSSSIVSGLSGSDLQDERTDQRDEDENSLSTSISSTQEHTKNVVFQELVTVFFYETPNHNEAAEESNAFWSLLSTSASSSSSVQGTKGDEDYSGWYNNQDLRNFKMDVVETVDRILAGEIGGADNDDFCSRGCEYRTPVGTVLRQKHRRDGLNAVLGYQSEQRRRGKVVDPEQLGKVYAAVSRHSQTVANVMGNIDHSVVMGGPSPPPPPPPSSPSLASHIDHSISKRVSHSVTADCSKLELEKPPLELVEKALRRSRRIDVYNIPSPQVFAFRRHLFHPSHTERVQDGR